MNQIVTTGIILARTDFGEADRIITLLTPDRGKIRLIAKGVRRAKSKLAGGVELFSCSHITYIPGRGEIGTLVSARLIKHYATIVQNIERTMFGYEVLKTMNKATEDMADIEYFTFLEHMLEGLDTAGLPLESLRLWFTMQLVRLAGHSPNLRTDTTGDKLAADQNYSFSVDDMSFSPSGRYSAAHIKLLRLAVGLESPLGLGQVSNIEAVLVDCMRLSQLMLI